jgi:hypothetical protein
MISGAAFTSISGLAAAPVENAKRDNQKISLNHF